MTNIYGSIGDPGTGKTLWLAAVGYDAADDADVYSNMQGLKMDYNLMEDYRDIDNIPKDKVPKVLLLDELHMFGGDSWRYNQLAKKLAIMGTQSRKMHVSIYYTTQYFSQIINRLRFLTQELYSHNVNYYTQDAKPLALQTTVYGKREKDYYYKNSMIFPLVTKDNHLVCDLYDTDEFINELKDPDEILKQEMINKYKDFDLETKGNDKILKGILVIQENMEPAIAGHLINFLKYK